MEFSSLVKGADKRTTTFTLSPVHVSYANTLRRLILTGVETIAFRADMTSTGTTTDVVVKRNDTPMTNEMLAARIGLLPLHVPQPRLWNEKEYQFVLQAEGDADRTRYVTASDFRISRLTAAPHSTDEPYDEKENIAVPTEQFFPPHPLTGQTCLIATLQPGSGANQQKIEIIAKATRGTGREHARFSPVSQCSYEYTLDNNSDRIQKMFEAWLLHAKKMSVPDKTLEPEKYAILDREFRTMQIKRCYKIDENNEPYSYDFTVETVGPLSVEDIVQRACEVGENMCSLYVNMGRGKLPSEITISNANCRLIGYDFLFRGHDHTLGNLLQTWLVQHHVEGNAQPKITYAGFSVPHPLRDEMLLRIGVEDGEESTARAAVAAAAQGCAGLFREMRMAWLRSLKVPFAPVSSAAPVSSSTRPRRPPVASRAARPSSATLPATAATAATSSATAAPFV